MTGALAARRPASSYDWRLIVPSSVWGSDTAALAEVSEFRGRILYAGGRRPGFLRAGRYADDDSADPGSFHVTVRDDGRLVGCVRMRALPDYAQTSLRLLLSRPQFNLALRGMRLATEQCLEVSRWIVAPSERGSEIGAALVVSAWAIGIWLRKQRLLATVGTRDGQATMLARFGGQVLHGAEAKLIPEYDDEVTAMFFDLTAPPPRVEAKLRAVRRLLNIATDEFPSSIAAAAAAPA